MPIDLMEMFATGLRKKDVSIVEFAESTDFCNKPLFPRQRVLLKTIFLEELNGFEEDILQGWIDNRSSEVNICPDIRKRIDILRNKGYKHFREIILVGGRRCSKGHITGISVAKKMYDLINLENPQAHYGIDRDKAIYATIVAASEDQAKRYQFADAKAAIMACKALEPYFNKFLEKQVSLLTPRDLDNYHRLKSISNVKMEADIATVRIKPSAANASTIRGEATMVLVMDEMAHMMEGVNSKSSADEIFEAATPALDQFGIDAMIFENSSPYTKIGKFYENYLKAMNIDENNDKVDMIDYRMFCFQMPSWELYKDWERDPERRFRNAIVVSPEFSEEMKMEEEKNPEKFAVERRAIFAEVVDGFLNPNKVDQMFKPWNGRTLHTRMDRSGFGPHIIFKAHADPSTTTANFGCAIAHTEYADDGHNREVPHVIFDWIHCWRPQDFPDHTINFLDIQDEILEKIRFFRPVTFTFDQFQSKGLIQWLRREARTQGAGDTQIREITATEQVNARRAYNFKAALNLNLIHAPADFDYYDLAKNELKFLQEKGKRIVKQDIGPVTTKDIADCLMEVTDALLGGFLDNQAYFGEASFGAPRGYTSLEFRNAPEGLSDYYRKKSIPSRTRTSKVIPRIPNYNKMRTPLR